MATRQASRHSSRMPPGRYAVAVGASPQWIRNASSILGRELTRTPDEAARLGLARQIHEELGITLERAWKIAGRALARDTEAAFRNPDGVVRLVIDVDRYRSDFAARLSRARTQYEPGRRGRRRRIEGGSAVERARRYGLDVSLLDERLRRSPAERLNDMDEMRDQILELRSAKRR